MMKFLRRTFLKVCVCLGIPLSLFSDVTEPEPPELPPPGPDVGFYDDGFFDDAHTAGKDDHAAD